MAHEINEGRMFYTGETPWHGIGTKLDNPATAKEAIMASRLDYEVVHEPIRYNGLDTDSEDRRHPSLVLTKRADNGDCLGIVRPNYKIIQNIEAFDFFDSVVGAKMAIYETAGALGRGERIWMLAKIPNSLIVRDEQIDRYLVLSNSHDGKSTLRMYFTPIRVVCQNTLIVSLRNASTGISIRHSGDLKFKVEQAQKALGIAKVFYDNFADVVEKFMGVKMTPKNAEGYFDSVLSENGRIKKNDFMENRRNDLLTLFETGKGNSEKGVRHTLWTAYNAVTEFVDHKKPLRMTKAGKVNRVHDIWLGSGARMKELAFDNAMAMANIGRN